MRRLLDGPEGIRAQHHGLFQHAVLKGFDNIPGREFPAADRAIAKRAVPLVADRLRELHVCQALERALGKSKGRRMFLATGGSSTRECSRTTMLLSS